MLIKELNNNKWPNLAAKWNGAIFSKSNTNLYFLNSETTIHIQIKLSQIDSSPDKAQNNPKTFFFLTPLHRAAQLPNIKNPWDANGYTPLHKAAPFGLLQKSHPN